MLRKPGFSPIPSRRRNSSKDGSKEGMYLQFNRIYIILALLFVVLPLAFLFHTTYKRSLHISPTIRSRNSPLHPTDSDVDCVVYISYHRSHGHVELALSNLRSRGGYQGPVYLITDKPEDWSDPSITAVLASKSDIGKQLKTRILHYTPESCVNVLYMDTDALFVKTALRPIKEGEATTPLRVELEVRIGIKGRGRDEAKRGAKRRAKRRASNDISSGANHELSYLRTRGASSVATSTIITLTLFAIRFAHHTL